MMPVNDWEQIHYHQLPDWMKKNAKPGQRINRTQTKIFSGTPYDYKVQYTVIHDIVSISYWRAAHRTKPVKFPGSGFRVILFLIVLLLSFILLSYILPFIGGQSGTIPPGTNISEFPETGLTPVPTENITPPLETIPDTGYQQSPKTVSYSYFTDNNRNYISLTTYGGLSDYFSKERHSLPYGEEREMITNRLENASQDEYLQPFIETIRKRSPGPDDQAKIAISLVQHMPTTLNKAFNDPMDWYYPYETLYSNGGASADKSLLSAYLLKELGYDTVLFEYPNHMAVGVKCSSDYDFYDTGYAFIETTRPTIITYVPDTYYGGFSVSANPRIIHVNDGKRILDVSSEYQDALRLKQLERMGGVLDQGQYTELLKISDKYDLQEDHVTS